MRTLKQIRQEAEITQRGLSKLLNIDFTYISKIENGLMTPAFETYREWCEYIYATPEEFYNNYPDKNNAEYLAYKYKEALENIIAIETTSIDKNSRYNIAKMIAQQALNQ